MLMKSTKQEKKFVCVRQEHGRNEEEIERDDEAIHKLLHFWRRNQARLNQLLTFLIRRRKQSADAWSRNRAGIKQSSEMQDNLRVLQILIKSKIS